MSDETPHHGVWQNATSASDATGRHDAASMARRLRRVERTLDVRFDANPSEVPSNGMSDQPDLEQQASELLQAFRQIANTRTRQQFIEMVRYAAGSSIAARAARW
ncbi:hypothetical protein [Methylobacterium oryzihabitans]|uniref:Uncharacterized protein n=1 Tax=Methylobacterium oryzihabitans TaxID=2499852 RepID=A0A437P9Y4_9HYPH|nr:hypothetical protein [Methylobacterium oryzihabitans]RVU19102.1 hypothetical protein EOE48_09415 [Methylobacterium oryzihabitans]